MNKNILNTDVQLFILKNLNTDISSLLLKGIDLDGVSAKEAVQQIEAKKKSKNKLPTWYTNNTIYYPDKLHIEQTSSEKTALYKSKLVSGKHLIDITGGFGVDAYYFSKKFEWVTHCETNKNLSEIAAHNFKILNAENIIPITVDGIEYLKKSDMLFDCVFVDPSRRDAVKNKVFLLHNCEPDITKILPFLFSKTNTVLVKTSPLIDLSKGIEELKKVQEIHVVAVNNEVKELLWVLKPTIEGAIKIKTANILKDSFQKFNFSLDEEASNLASYALPKKYIYEPNAAILKSGGFNVIAQKLSLDKLHPNTHLYTSDSIIDFPGRRFKLKEILLYNKKALKKILPDNKAHITTRNFPESVAQIRKKTKIKDGGDAYLFFCTNHRNEKIVLHTEKI